MEPVVRYAAHEDLPRVNELRQQVSELHAAGRPDIFRPGSCEALQQHVYQLFDAPEFDVLVACVGETICGFAANGILISLPQTREIDTKKGPFLGEVSELISQGAAGDREISETLSQRSREGAAHRAGVS